MGCAEGRSPGTCPESIEGVSLRYDFPLPGQSLSLRGRVKSKRKSGSTLRLPSIRCLRHLLGTNGLMGQGRPFGKPTANG